MKTILALTVAVMLAGAAPMPATSPAPSHLKQSTPASNEDCFLIMGCFIYNGQWSCPSPLVFEICKVPET